MATAQPKNRGKILPVQNQPRHISGHSIQRTPPKINPDTSPMCMPEMASRWLVPVSLRICLTVGSMSVRCPLANAQSTPPCGKRSKTSGRTVDASSKILQARTRTGVARIRRMRRCSEGSPGNCGLGRAGMACAVNRVPRGGAISENCSSQRPQALLTKACRPNALSTRPRMAVGLH